MMTGLLALPSSPFYNSTLTTLLICRWLAAMATNASRLDMEGIITAVATSSWGALALLNLLLPDDSLSSSIQICFAGWHKLCTQKSIP
jgi:hypothetical protein